MNRILKISFTVSLVLSVLNAQDLKETSTVEEMFLNATVSGEIRMISFEYNQEAVGEGNTYATAVGGKVKYELAELNGFNAAMAVRTSYDMDLVTGDGAKQNSELSSSDGKCTVASEVYLNYKNGGFNFRAGRQIIDTPLADSDDIRMIPNTFEAYIATYEIDNLNFMLGNLQDWQGFDAGLDDGWVKAGEDGTWFGGITYTTDTVEASAWYYNITKLTNTAYFDIALNYEINSDVSIVGAAQYLNENEISNSGTEASIYGVMAELLAYNVGFTLAYNDSSRKAGKETFSGFGGGTLFTSMDTLILNDIAVDRDVRVVVAGISYEFDDISIFYAYGDSDGGADGLGVKAHNTEYDIGFEYTISDELIINAVYTIHEDKENLAKTDFYWDRFYLILAYNF
ncbi:MAG: OprD family outer membrane porin [Sulfurimonas sp.]|nr:OprD family outer membrane porin [Sulfurimonas sp.]